MVLPPPCFTMCTDLSGWLEVLGFKQNIDFYAKAKKLIVVLSDQRSFLSTCLLRTFWSIWISALWSVLAMATLWFYLPFELWIFLSRCFRVRLDCFWPLYSVTDFHCYAWFFAFFFLENYIDSTRHFTMKTLQHVEKFKGMILIFSREQYEYFEWSWSSKKEGINTYNRQNVLQNDDFASSVRKENGRLFM